MIARRAVEWLLVVAAAASLAGVTAWWGWHWFGPAPGLPPSPPEAEVAPALALALSPPFGTSREPAAASGVAPPRGGELRLLGVIAEPGGGGHALLRFPDGTARLVPVGERLWDGATLAAVLPDAVVVRDGAGERTVALRAQRPSTPSPGAAPARGAGCAVPRDYRGAVVRLNAELVQGLIGDPQALRAVVEAQDGALVVRDEAGFATMLGLRKGDRVVQANGIALRAPEDVVVSVLRPLAANQPVRVQGARGGETRELLIFNAGACPG